jgi:hypothetical protein
MCGLVDLVGGVIGPVGTTLISGAFSCDGLGVGSSEGMRWVSTLSSGAGDGFVGVLACFWISGMSGANLTCREGFMGRVSGSIAWIWGEAKLDLLVRISLSSLRTSSSVGGIVSELEFWKVF